MARRVRMESGGRGKERMRSRKGRGLAAIVGIESKENLIWSLVLGNPSPPLSLWPERMGR